MDELHIQLRNANQIKHEWAEDGLFVGYSQLWKNRVQEDLIILLALNGEEAASHREIYYKDIVEINGQEWAKNNIQKNMPQFWYTSVYVSCPYNLFSN